MLHLILREEDKSTEDKLYLWELASEAEEKT